MIVDELLNEINSDVLTSQVNFAESENLSNLQIVLYENPDVDPITSIIFEEPEKEVYENMTSFFANFIEIDSEDDESTKFEKVWKIKDEDQDDIIVLSDSEIEVGLDAKDLEEVINDLLRYS